MEQTSFNNVGFIFFFMLIALAIVLIPAIFFLITQQNTLKAIQPENRTMNPGEVWLQLIPLFGWVWQFIVVSRISDSLRREFNSWTNDTIFQGQGNAAIYVGYSKPTYGIGLAMCICNCCTIVPCLGYLAWLGALVCWIIYWVQLAEWKGKVQRRFY